MHDLIITSARALKILVPHSFDISIPIPDSMNSGVMTQFQVKEAEKNCEYQVRYKDEQMDGRIRELEEHYERLLDEARTKYETLKMEKSEMVINV